MATFVSSEGLWIQADMRENNISRIEAGDPVEFALDVAPGRVFSGTVRSVGYGVSTAGGLDRGDLPTVSSSQGWLRDPQRFPELSWIRYEDGVASYLEVLETQRALFGSQLATSQTRQLALNSVVDLYAALGGGWQVRQER